MSTQLIIQGRRKVKARLRPRRSLQALLERVETGTGAALAYPGYTAFGDGDSRRTWITGALSALLHLGGLAVLLLIASLAPEIEERFIPVQLLRDDPEPEAPAPAPKALAERRSVHYAPAIQTVSPQIINPRVITSASPAIHAEALQMDAVNSVAAPTTIQHSLTQVERVSAVNSAARARATSIDVTSVVAPVVRGPIQANSPVGPSVGPRRVEASDAAPTTGTAPLKIGSGNGSSVREGVLSSRDVVGSPDGALVVSIDTAIGNSHLRGSGGTGTSIAPASTTQVACLQRPEVADYMSDVRIRTLARWMLPPGVSANTQVRLRFRLDVAGSATSISVVNAGDNALGATAIDALRAASPFPPMPEPVRCLSQFPLIGTFSNPVEG